VACWISVDGEHAQKSPLLFERHSIQRDTDKHKKKENKHEGGYAVKVSVQTWRSVLRKNKYA